ncbi:glucose-6-phosphate dehydrogenase assembly protein OpcA [Pseudactinotalea suaedae]|uniref:glucose-6-phosphate dehydrogenase assembly protein OpcA n=1 Tax=Pseudactinotalea suaedae TaxID=1524924 RepID=UPI0012E13B0B|nr:glucose-6-phosphate dehydrogenase assembly protein OpcA [Pseudactinotalea suaedae]
MKISLKDTTASAVASRLVGLREEGGAVALGRVLTLIIVTDGADIENAIRAANEASMEHPCRVIVVRPGDGRRAAGLDAEIRVGADAGASDVVVLEPRGPGRNEVDTLVTPLLLPDAPIVVWWPKNPPADMSADLLGRMAQRRISDVGECSSPIELLHQMAQTYAPGDTDLSWARTTLWRGVVAAALDERPYETVREVRVYGSTTRPSAHLFAGWLAHALKLPVTLEHVPGSSAVDGIDLVRRTGTISMRRPVNGAVVTIEQPDQPVRRVAMAKRPLEDCLMEDLRRLDPDEAYQLALVKGLPKVVVEA